MHRSWGRLISVLAAFFLGVALTGVATGHGGFAGLLHANHSDTMDGTLTAKGFRFKTMKTARLVIPGTAFLPVTYSPAPDMNRSSESGFMGTSDPAVAPVILPQGAQLVKLVWFHDPGEEGTRLELHSATRASQYEASQLAEVTPTAVCDGTEPCADEDTISHTVNNKRLNYELSLPNGGTVMAAVIVYKVATPGTE